MDRPPASVLERWDAALERLFWPLFVLCAAFALAPLWAGRYLPMVDLPQWAAQISVLRHYSDPAFGFQPRFELHPFTPYAAMPFLGAQLLRFFDIFTTLKLLLSFCVLGLGLSLCFLLRQTGGDRWWSLAGLLWAYGPCFYWGFVGHLGALPLAAALFGLTLRHGRRPSAASGLLLFLCAVLLFFTHVVVFAAAVGLAFVMLAAEESLGLAALLPLAAALPLVPAWLSGPAGRVIARHDPASWLAFEPQRLLSFPSELLYWTADPLAWCVSAAVLAAAVLGARAERPSPKRLAPFAAAAMLYLLIAESPSILTQMPERLALFAAVLFLASLRAGGSARRRLLSRGLLMLCLLSWSASLFRSFRAFDRKVRGFDDVLAAAGNDKTGLSLSFVKGLPGWHPLSLQHFISYLQAVRGGSAGDALSYAVQSLVRSRPGAAALDESEASQLDWDPGSFEASRSSSFDYFLISSGADRSAIFKGQAELVGRRSFWWLYRRIKTPGTRGL